MIASEFRCLVESFFVMNFSDCLTVNRTIAQRVRGREMQGLYRELIAVIVASVMMHDSRIVRSF
jgi:hypothetical protein